MRLDKEVSVEAFRAVEEVADAHAAARCPPLPDSPAFDPEHVFRGHVQPPIILRLIVRQKEHPGLKSRQDVSFP